MENPLVSVIVTVYNREEMVKETLDSVVNQTYTDLEIICIDDCSTDNSLKTLNEYAAKDARIKVVARQENCGQGSGRNVGIDMARGKYVAMLDSDDICMPERIEKQTAYMEQHNDIGMCGTWAYLFGAGCRDSKKPLAHAQIKLGSIFLKTPFISSSVFMRKDFLDSHNLRYSEILRTCEDAEFYTRAERYLKCANIPEILIKYRRHNGSNCKLRMSQRKNDLPAAALDLACHELGLTDDEKDKIAFFYGLTLATNDNIADADFFIDRLLRHNEFKELKPIALKFFFAVWYNLYKTNPQLTKVWPFIKVSFKYRTAYKKSLRLLFKSSK